MVIREVRENQSSYLAMLRDNVELYRETRGDAIFHLNKCFDEGVGEGGIAKARRQVEDWDRAIGCTLRVIETEKAKGNREGVV